MKIILLLSCIIAISNAIPVSDTTKEITASKFESDGPQPVDEVIAIANGGEEHSSKRVARHYGFGGVNVAVGVPVVYSSYPVYGYGGGWGGGYGYGGYGGGWGRGYGGGWGRGYGGGWGRGYGGGWGRGWGHHHHHHGYWR